jgi:hypothetical protein
MQRNENIKDKVDWRLLTLLCMNSELESKNFSPYTPSPDLIRPELAPYNGLLNWPG